MRTRIGFVLGALFVILGGALVAAESPPGEAAEQAVADRDLGLSRTSVFDVPAPEPVPVNASDPGDGPVLPRAYPIAPPRVPHAVADYLPISRSENLCVDCHLLAEAEEGDPTPIPASHLTDLRNAPQEIGEDVVGARWVCLSCHAVATGAQPLVGTSFGTAAEPVAAPGEG